MRKKNQVTH